MQRVGMGQNILRIPLKEGILLLLLIGLVLLLSTLSGEFLTLETFWRLSRYAAEIGLIALPMTMLIISRGIDLSVASVVALSALLLGWTWKATGQIEMAIAVSLLVGSLCGLFNGLIVTRLRVPPLVVTLATLALFRGIATGLSGGRGVTGFPESFLQISQGTVGLLPIPLLLWGMGTIGAALLLHRTAFGRKVYAIGHNEVASLFSGVHVRRVILWQYVLSGFICGLVAVLYVARVATAKSNAALGYELRVITAVVLGGTSLSGGEGSILGTTLGVLILAVLNTGLTLARVPTHVQDVLVGLLLISAVLLYSTPWRVGNLKQRWQLKERKGVRSAQAHGIQKAQPTAVTELELRPSKEGVLPTRTEAPSGLNPSPRKEKGPLKEG